MTLKENTMTTTWTPPATIHLTSSDISNVVAGLRNPESRPDALAFVDTLVDPGYVYTVACEVSAGKGWPDVSIGVDGYRDVIRNRV